MIKVTFNWVPSFEKNPKYTNYLETGVYKDEKCLYLLTNDGQMIRYYLENVKKIEKQVKYCESLEIRRYAENKYGDNLKEIKICKFYISIKHYVLKKDVWIEDLLTFDDYIDVTELVKE